MCCVAAATCTPAAKLHHLVPMKILGISVWDMKCNTIIIHTIIRNRLISNDSPHCFWHVDSAFLVTSPGCLTHGYLSNCLCLHLWREPGQWVNQSATGMTLFTVT